MITSEQRSIIEHASKSPNRAYCDNSDHPDLLHLVEIGMMRGPIKARLLPDGAAYFLLIGEWKQKLRDLDSTKGQDRQRLKNEGMLDGDK